MKQKKICAIAIVFLLAILGYYKLYCCKTIITKKNSTKEIAISQEEKNPEEKKEDNINSILELRQKYNNDDIISELEISSLDLHEIITKTDNNEYYLNNDLYKNYNMYGNPYIDFRNSDDLSMERQINIYSHNIEDKSLKKNASFSKLEKLLDKNIFDKTKYIYLKTEKELIKYELYAVKIITNEKEHMILDANSKEKWQSHLDKLLSNTINCKDECKLQSDAELLVLQTCYFDPKDSYLIVIGKKIK